MAGTIDAETTVPLARLRAGYSPRFERHDDQHAQLLARSGAQLPAIVVNRATMEVIDGHHRILAARLRGEREIRVRFFDGTEDEALLAAIRANVRHGKPLTLLERKRAATEVLARLPALSDRAISECCGLAPGTVKSIRERAGAQNEHLRDRVGRDGRHYPADPTEARQELLAQLRADPTSTDHQVAQAAGASSNTVRRLRRSLGAERSSPAHETRTDHEGRPFGGSTPDHRTSTEQGLGRFLAATAVRDEEWLSHLDEVPAVRLQEVADEARRRSCEWLELADRLDQECRSRTAAKDP